MLELSIVGMAVTLVGGFIGGFAAEKTSREEERKAVTK